MMPVGNRIGMRDSISDFWKVGGAISFGENSVGILGFLDKAKISFGSVN